MTNPVPRGIPPIDDDSTVPDAATVEIDDKPRLDPDANDDLVDSADADRLAAEGGSPSEPS